MLFISAQACVKILCIQYFLFMKQIQSAPGVPPAIALLLNEIFPLFDQVASRRRLRELVPEIRRQTELLPIGGWYEGSNVSFGDKTYSIFMDGGLDLFTGEGACWNLPCRIGYADQIARSIVLMADNVWMQDTFTPRVLDRSRLVNDRLNSLLDDIRVLQRLRPLIEGGIVKFVPQSSVGLCVDCATTFYGNAGTSIKSVIEEFKGGVRFESVGEDFALYSGEMFDPPLYKYVSADIDEKIRDDIAVHLAVSSIMDSCWTAKNAAKFGGSMFSNSRVGLAGLLKMEGDFPGVDRLHIFEGQRAGSLPWVQGLSVEQTLHLREEADLALPRLREFLARHLSANPLQAVADLNSENKYVLELREQAAEVEAELKLATKRKPSLASAAKGVAALGLIAYGFAQGSLVSGEQLALLMSSLALLHDVYGHEAPDVESIKAKPGYVLVAAKDILAHAKG